MQLKDYILEYKNHTGIVANLFDYYEKYIKFLDKEFEKYSYYSSALVLCYFKDHEDVNPSMGWIRDKNHKGGMVCHCFGCGRTADVVRLHQILRKQYEHVDLNENEACKELATIFDIPLENYDELAEDDYEGQYMRTFRKIDVLAKQYTVRDYSDELRTIRQAGGDLKRLNDAYIKMTATVKKLYD